MLNNDVILITGGTGSFGHAMVSRLLSSDVMEIRVFSRDESKQDAMRRKYPRSNLRFYLGDVRDPRSVDAAMAGVTRVFHAAALKQVPSCEFFPMQAVLTNVIGSANVVESAIRHQVASVVCLSTDKAVMPINAMGMTKALMEKVALACARDAGRTVVSTVRYGNVMYSRGSVIPLFVAQAKRGEPLTITDPSMTRFMLPLGEALDLVEFALEHGRPGDTFVRKAPAATVADVAGAVRQIFGSDSEIHEIGVRHGEKIYETLATHDELIRADDMGGHYRIAMDDRDLNYDNYFVTGTARAGASDDYTSHNTNRLTAEEVRELLLSLAEFQAELTGASGDNR